MMHPLAANARRSLSLTTTKTTTTTTTPCGHPLIDVAKLREGSDETTSDLRRALFDYGYFYAANVAELPAEYIRSLYDYSAACHGLSPRIKNKYRQRDGGTGAYSGPDIGQPELQYEAGGVDARVRAWDYSRTRFSLAAAARDGDGGTGDDDGRYPASHEIHPPFATVLDECYGRQDALARVLLGGFERALDIPSGTLVGMFDAEGGDFGTIRLLHYPGDDVDDDDRAIGTTGIGAHTDFECFTLMHQTAPGLQILPRAPPGDDDGGDGGHYSREWTDMPVRDSEFVVIIGDMLERLTNGALLATPHRVMPTAHSRDSIIRFNAFAPSTIIAPMRPFVTDERPSLYSAVTMSTHMEVTMRNLEEGMGSWDESRRISTSARRDYGGERRVLEVGSASV